MKRSNECSTQGAVEPGLTTPSSRRERALRWRHDRLAAPLVVPAGVDGADPAIPRALRPDGARPPSAPWRATPGCGSRSCSARRRRTFTVRDADPRRSALLTTWTTPTRTPRSAPPRRERLGRSRDSPASVRLRPIATAVAVQPTRTGRRTSSSSAPTGGRPVAAITGPASRRQPRPSGGRAAVSATCTRARASLRARHRRGADRACGRVLAVRKRRHAARLRLTDDRRTRRRCRRTATERLRRRALRPLRRCSAVEVRRRPTRPIERVRDFDRPTPRRAGRMTTVWSEACGATAYDDVESEVERRTLVMSTHADRPGFRARCVDGDGGRLLGFGYGMAGAPGSLARRG